MLLAKVLLLGVVGSAVVLIGLLVLLRDYLKLQNQLFFLFSFALGGWVLGIAGFLLTNDPIAALWWAKSYYGFPMLLAVALPLFAYSFPFNSSVKLKVWLPIAAGCAFVLVPLLTIKTFVTTDLVYHEWGKEIVLNKAHYALYSVYLVGSLGFGLWHAYRKSQHLRGLVRAQVRFFVWGFLITSSFGIYFNLILPWFGNYRLIWLGPLFSSAVVAVMAYSIVKHKVFDMRLVVARSFGYISSLAIFMLLYGFVLFNVANFVFGLHFSFWAQATISLLTGLAALSFGYFRKRFDKLTNRLFYRDAYDTGEFFGAFNAEIVSTVDLDQLLQRSASVLGQYLKPSFCMIGVKDGSNSGYRIAGTAEIDFSPEDIAKLRRLTPKMHRMVLVTDNLDAHEQAVQGLLMKNNIAVLARLAPHVRKAEEGIGYIVLGPKKSGNPYTRQDINTVENAANELIIAAQNALRFEEIEQFNRTLQERIDKATFRLSESNKKLKAMDETKDDFIGMASHQMRTPLTSVKGYLSLVLDGDAGSITPVQRKLLSQAFISSQRMVFLIADLLNVSRLKTGKFVIESMPTDLARLIADEVKQLVDTAKSRELTIEYDKPADFPVLNLDETKTRQVVMNFIDNAIYYTPQGGTIRVSLRDLPQSIELRVTDSGIGVPKHEQHHLFTKFFRAKNAQKARPDGTGLGLFMAKKVIIAQGGAIIFESQEGKGSTFGFTFPKSAVMPPADTAESVAMPTTVAAGR